MKMNLFFVFALCAVFVQADELKATTIEPITIEPTTTEEDNIHGSVRIKDEKKLNDLDRRYRMEIDELYQKSEDSNYVYVSRIYGGSKAHDFIRGSVWALAGLSIRIRIIPNSSALKVDTA